MNTYPHSGDTDGTLQDGHASGRTSALEALFCDPAAGGRLMNYPSRAVLCEPDHPALDVYYIHKGQVRLHQVTQDGTSMLLEILGPGQWFGAAAVAGRSDCGIRAITEGPATITKAPAASVMHHICSTPDGARAMIQELAGRQVASFEDSARLVFDDCNSRLIKTLLRFSDTAAATRRDDTEGGGVVLRITHQQLAQAVGVARETVSLALTQLRKQNVVRTGRNQLFFDPDALKNFQARGSVKPSEV